MAYGYQLIWKIPRRGHVNIYPNSHIEQPIVFGKGVYGFVVGAWAGSMSTPASNRRIFITVLPRAHVRNDRRRTCRHRPLEST